MARGDGAAVVAQAGLTVDALLVVWMCQRPRRARMKAT
jgi:hypothetical protein